MRLGEVEKIWENPNIDVNYKNYEEGLIRGYRLGFQDEEWYKKNKDNFSNSLLNKYPNLLPSFMKDPKKVYTDNYLGFYPDEFIRYGFLEQADVLVQGKKSRFWVVRIPAGLQVYHSSRSLGLNHSDFPIRGYSNDLTSQENKQRILQQCPSTEFIGHKKEDIMEGICTYISYYSSPYVTSEYLKKDDGFGGDQIKYAYGINEFEYSTDRDYNDRLRQQADEYKYGVQAYKLVKDTYFVILGLDDYLIERPDLGRENMRLFKRTMAFLSPEIQENMKADFNTMNNFFDLINTVTGIGSLADNVRIITRDYRSNINFETVVLNWVEQNGNTYLDPETRTNTAGYIKNTARGVREGIKDLNRYKGVRFSTYEHDKPVMNMLGWLFGNYPVKSVTSDQDIKVNGFISSSMFVPKRRGTIKKDRSYKRKGLTYYIPNGVFHSEIGMFHAPENLSRDRDNKYDLDYSLNYVGISQEMRKYKTTNIMHYENIQGNMTVQGFHQGHLLEHSTWVGLIAGNMWNKQPFRQFKSGNIIPRDTYLISGYLHDIGKSGECVEHAVYKGLNYQDPKLSMCRFVTKKRNNYSNQIIGMKYYDIPEHPEKGYEYLKGYKVYKKFTLMGTDSPDNYNKNSIPVYLNDWEDMFEHMNVDSFNKRLIRIAVGAHWYYGDSIRNIIDKDENIDGAAIDFVRKIEIFHNDEFFILDKKVLFSVIVFVVTLSVSDIIGSEYDPSIESSDLLSDERATLINLFPNISQSDYYNPADTRSVVDQVIYYALQLKNNSPYKRKIIDNITENITNFLSSIRNYIYGDFEFDRSNNYSLLYNLTYSYPSIVDIKRAYISKFPKVISFDLDQTMFAVQFNPNALSSYYIYPDTYRIMEDVQKVRKKYFPNNPTYIAVTSRHYSPKSLLKLLNSPTYNGKSNPLYYANFDYIISRYTGPDSKIQNDMSGVPNFFQYNGYPSDGFVIDTDKNSYRKIPNNDPNFPDLDKISKHGHFNTLKNRYNVDYSDILSFDDDEMYFTSKGLGLAEDVKVAGVLKSNDINKQGIRKSLFKKGVAYYLFDRIY